MPSTEHFDHCRTPSGCPQCSSRQRVANICRFERLETSTTNITTFSQGQRDRPVYHKANQSVKALCELAPRPTCCGHGRVFNRLEPTERIRVSTIQPHPKNINESDKRQCEPNTSSPSVANSTLVVITLQLTVKQPVILHAFPALLEDPSNPTGIYPMHSRLQLAVCTISNNSAQQQAFRTQLPTLCPQLHVSPPTKHMIVHRQNGLAGVIECRKLIQFQPMSKTF